LPGLLINNWTNAASARWYSSTNWSLGILPASNQTVTITNAGYKAVNVDSASFATVPDSATVSNLLVAGADERPQHPTAQLYQAQYPFESVALLH
jgi:hypothetical protein